MKLIRFGTTNIDLDAYPVETSTGLIASTVELWLFGVPYIMWMYNPRQGEV